MVEGSPVPGATNCTIVIPAGGAATARYGSPVWSSNQNCPLAEVTATGTRGVTTMFRVSGQPRATSTVENLRHRLDIRCHRIEIDPGQRGSVGDLDGGPDLSGQLVRGAGDGHRRDAEHRADEHRVAQPGEHRAARRPAQRSRASGGGPTHRGGFCARRSLLGTCAACRARTAAALGAPPSAPVPRWSVSGRPARSVSLSVLTRFPPARRRLQSAVSGRYGAITRIRRQQDQQFRPDRGDIAGAHGDHDVPRPQHPGDEGRGRRPVRVVVHRLPDPAEQLPRPAHRSPLAAGPPARRTRRAPPPDRHRPAPGRRRRRTTRSGSTGAAGRPPPAGRRRTPPTIRERHGQRRSARRPRWGDGHSRHTR